MFGRSRIDWGWMGIYAWFGGALLLIVLAGYGEVRARARFMDECQEERKRYECEAMWRAGDARAVVVPVVITR